MIAAVILDWAGTTVDHGCVAPVLVLEEIFAAMGVPLERSEARHAMGLLKVDQIQEICRLERVADAWATRHGAPPGEADIQDLFATFLPAQLRIIESHSGLIDGVLDFFGECQRRGIRVGTTTGYTRPMLDLVIARAAREGYRPEATVTPEEAGGGRPAPWMIYRCTQLLNVFPLSRCVKIGDTLSDIAEGRNAGMYTIALTSCGNEVGLSASEFAALSEGERAAKTQQAELVLAKGQPDFFAPSLGACIPLLDKIESLLAARAAS